LKKRIRAKANTYNDKFVEERGERCDRPHTRPQPPHSHTTSKYKYAREMSDVRERERERERDE
jgi:hypothetical protein